jgi:hypothetical protein
VLLPHQIGTIPNSIAFKKSVTAEKGGGRKSLSKQLSKRSSTKSDDSTSSSASSSNISNQVYEWTKKMSNLACVSSLPTVFAPSKSQNITQQQQHQHQNSRPPRSSRSSAHHMDDVYHPQKPHSKHVSGGNSHDEMDMHTLGTASTSAATTSYSMTDDASEASESGMEVIMTCVGESSFTTPTVTRSTTAVTMHSFKAGKETFTIPDRYSFLRTVGSGAYGVVISAQDAKNDRSVAIKMVPRAFNDEVDAKRILREIKLMKHLHHENIVSILDMIPPQAQYLDDFNDVYIVADLMETDLHRIIYSKQTLSIDHVQYFVYQMMRGLKYIHSANVIHRDLKPSNLLVNSNCDLKICDFGLARGIHDDDDDDDTMGETNGGIPRPPVLLTEYVVTRWYRAPEIMLACNEYSKPVDVWSVGCIFAELILRKPYFPGDDYIDQVRL